MKPKQVGQNLASEVSESEPLELFRAWYAGAGSCSAIVDASAMSLATADRSGRPSVRMVLLKHFDEDGFVFYTNLQSVKGTDLVSNPQAEICFHWAPLRQQVRIHGRVAPVTVDEADAYFRRRPRLSQLGAWASKQSSPMAHRYALEAEVVAAGLRFGLGARGRIAEKSNSISSPTRGPSDRGSAFPCKASAQGGQGSDPFFPILVRRCLFHKTSWRMAFPLFPGSSCRLPLGIYQTPLPPFSSYFSSARNHEREAPPNPVPIIELN